MRKLLGHERVIVRFTGLYLLGLGLFFISWIIAILILAGAALREAYMIVNIS